MSNVTIQQLEAEAVKKGVPVYVILNQIINAQLNKKCKRRKRNNRRNF